jgi:hypothetical protein
MVKAVMFQNNRSSGDEGQSLVLRSLAPPRAESKEILFEIQRASKVRSHTIAPGLRACSRVFKTSFS